MLVELVVKSKIRLRKQNNGYEYLEVTIPKEVRQALELEKGDVVEWDIDEDEKGKYFVGHIQSDEEKES